MSQHDRDDDLLDLAIRTSVGGRIASALDDAVSSAWSSSASRTVWIAIVSTWRALDAPTKIRTIALGSAVTMAVHRAMALLGPSEPLGAVLPSLVFVASALIAALAGPIARTLERHPR